MNAVDGQVSLFGFVSYDGKHGRGQIDRQTSHAASCQRHDSATRSTAQIGRDPVPGTQAEFGALTKAWIDTGAAAFKSAAGIT